MILNETFDLANGVKIPKIGFGTWEISNEAAKDVVKNAIEAGYIHIDTAQAYGNEEGVGKAIVNSGKNRSELFITTKVAAEFKTYDSALQSIDESLEKTGLDYFDLVIIHAPEPWGEFRGEKRYFKENAEVWKALETVYEEGKVRAIGVSNFLKDDLEHLLESAKVKPMVNQILAHIGNMDEELIQYCIENGILVEAYSPIAHGEILKNEAVKSIADQYDVSVARLCIKYILQRGLIVLPKATSREHMIDNTKMDFEISEEDMNTLNHIHSSDYGEFTFYPVFAGKKR